MPVLFRDIPLATAQSDEPLNWTYWNRRRAAPRGRDEDDSSYERRVAEAERSKQTFDAAVEATPLEFYKSLLGYEGKDVEPLVKSAEEIYQHLFGAKIKPESPDRASIWTDTNIYNELGIPAIKIGPRGKRISARNEEIDIDVMVKAAQLYALMALDICSRGRS